MATTTYRAHRRRPRTGVALLAAGLVVAATACWQPFDYDNDHRADFVVVHVDPMTSTRTYEDWDTGAVLSTAPSSASTPVPEDYDGDGAFDYAWVKPSTGEWFTNSSVGVLTFPASGGAPACPDARLRAVPADYDGDRAAEPAWYCGSTGTWYIEGQAPIVFGQPATTDLEDGEDIAVPEDYDGDLRVDLAVFNPATMAWQVRESSTGTTTTVTMVGNEHVAWPVPADYEGTGRVQRATVGPDGWVIDGNDEAEDYPQAEFDYESVHDVFDQYNLPAPADYDGDNYADLAMSGGWTVLHTEDYEDPEKVDDRPWSERDVLDAYWETRPGPDVVSGYLIPVQSVRLLNNLALLTFYACNLDPGC